MNSATNITVVFSWVGSRGEGYTQGSEERADGKCRSFTVSPDGSIERGRWFGKNFRGAILVAEKSLQERAMQ